MEALSISNFPGELTPVLRYFMISAVTLCFISSTLNALIIFILLWDLKTTFKRSNLIFLLNLAIWDFCFAFLMFGCSLKKLISGFIHFDHFDCYIEGLLNNVFGMNAFASIFLISIDRYIIVVRKTLLSLKTCLLSIAGCFVLSTFAAFSPMFFDTEDPYIVQPSRAYCLVDLSQQNPKMKDAVYVESIFYGVFSLLVWFSYPSIILEIRKTRSNLKSFSSKQQKHLESNIPSCSTTSTSKGNFFSTFSLKSLMNGNIKQSRKLDKNESMSVTIEHQSSPTAVTSTSTTNQTTSKKGLMKGKRPSSSHSHLTPMPLPIPSNRNSLDIQLIKKTMLIGTGHIIVFGPFAVCAILQMSKIPNLEAFDMFCLHCFYISLILDPTWSLLLDQHVRKNLKLVWRKLKGTQELS